MIRCLLLGGSGFLGRHVADRLAERGGADVITVDRRAGTADLPLDLATAGPAEVLDALRLTGATVVVNCAGATGTDSARLVADNVVAVATLVTATLRTAGRTRLVHIGSAAEYGPVPVGSAVTEEAETAPRCAYGVSKLAGTALVLAGVRQGLDATVLRLFNLVGPGTPTTLLPGRLVAELWAARDTGAPARVGTLDAYRDFVDVRDAARAIALTATRRRLPPVLNVGSGRATLLRDMAGAILRAAGGGTVVESAAGSPRSEEVVWQRADTGAAVRALGWRPEIDLDTSVRDMWLAATPVGSHP